MNETDVIKWLVSCSWRETVPNPHTGFAISKKGVRIPWAQTSRPVDYHFGDCSAFDCEDDARRYVNGCRHVDPGWLPRGAHSFEVSEPMRVARPKGGGQ